MSIYRKFARESPNDVQVTAAPRQAQEPAAIDDAKEEAERSKRRKGAPMNAPLPRTFTWAAKLPPEVQPIELMRSYARIANLIASSWDDRSAMYQYFDDLLQDRRGTRKGFPPEVMTELLALRAHYAAIYPAPVASWEDLNKR